MAYIKVDYTDDRVYGRYYTGPLTIVPTKKEERSKGHFYNLYEQTDTKLERPVEPKLTRSGEYKIVCHIFLKDGGHEKHLNYSIIDVDHPGILGIQTATFVQHYVAGKSKNYWYKDAQSIYFHHTDPLGIECDIINKSNEPIECQVFIEVHFCS